MAPATGGKLPRPGPARACALCGAPVPAAFRAPQPEIAPDLDLRPGEPTRSTMGQWLQSCRCCAAVAPDLAAPDLTARAHAALEPDARAALAAGNDPSQSPFLRWAGLCEAVGDPRNHAEALLQAAWDAEDRGENTPATALRLRVAELWRDTQDGETALRRLDVLRRAGAWQAGAAWAETVADRPLDETSTRILRFQRARIEARDSGRYLISAALPPPAHAPHVTHVRQRRPIRAASLLARLFGRD